MPTRRLSMRWIKQLLTMHFGAGASTRAIGRELDIAPSASIWRSDREAVRFGHPSRRGPFWALSLSG